MKYIDLIRDFWKEHDKKPFTPLETMFYLRLLEECNRRRWKNPFSLPSYVLEESVNPHRKTLVATRKSLQERGLIEFVAGNRKPTLFYLVRSDKNTDEFDEEFGVTKEMKIGIEKLIKWLQNVTRYVTLMLPKCYLNVTSGNINTYYNNTNVLYIYKDNKDIKEKSRKESHSPPSVSDVIDEFIRGNRQSYESALLKTYMTDSDFRQMAAEVIGLWLAGGWELQHIPKGSREYEGQKFIKWIEKQWQIAREDMMRLERLKPKKSYEQHQADILRYGAERLRAARSGMLTDREEEKPF